MHQGLSPKATPHATFVSTEEMLADASAQEKRGLKAAKLQREREELEENVRLMQQKLTDLGERIETGRARRGKAGASGRALRR